MCHQHTENLWLIDSIFLPSLPPQVDKVFLFPAAATDVGGGSDIKTKFISLRKINDYKNEKCTIFFLPALLSSLSSHPQ